MPEDDVTYYEGAFLQLRERLIRVLGVPTVNRLIDRAATEIRHTYPAVSSLQYEDDQLKLDGVRTALASESPTYVRDMYTALNGVLLLLCARLLGREIATRLTEGLTVADVLETGGFSG